jgi:hypothetical protein
MLNLKMLSGIGDALPITELALACWLRDAVPGDRLAYHRGYLAVDASVSESKLSVPERRELQRVAGAALAAALQGKVHAVQRRHGEGDYTYLLIARPRPITRRRRHVIPHQHLLTTEIAA